jgi:hypothetical protein
MAYMPVGLGVSAKRYGAAGCYACGLMRLSEPLGPVHAVCPIKGNVEHQFATWVAPGRVLFRKMAGSAEAPDELVLS